MLFQKRWWIGGLPLILGGLMACSRSNNIPQQQEERIIPVRLTFADSGTVLKTLPFPTTIKATPQTPVHPDVSGKFIRFTVQEGDYVEKGQTIAYLDRSLPGVPYKPVAVRAPVAGQIHRKVVDPGTFVPVEYPIAVILGAQRESIVEIPEGYVGRIPPRASVYALLPNGDTLQGRITWIGTMVDAQTRTFSIRIRWENTTLPPGVTVEAWVPVAHAQGLRLPRTVVLMFPRPHVFVIQNGRVQKRLVTVGLRGDRFIQVLDGIAPSDSVISIGNRVVRVGDRVTVERTTP